MKLITLNNQRFFASEKIDEILKNKKKNAKLKKIIDIVISVCSLSLCFAAWMCLCLR